MFLAIEILSISEDSGRWDKVGSRSGGVGRAARAGHFQERVALRREASLSRTLVRRTKRRYFFTSGHFGKWLKKARLPHCFSRQKEVWLGAESNRRHVDFQSTALPTELPSRNWRKGCAAPWGFHYAAMWLQGKRYACHRAAGTRLR